MSDRPIIDRNSAIEPEAKRPVRSLEVTTAMVNAAEAVMRRPGWSFSEIYRAMRLARPLSDGPGV